MRKTQKIVVDDKSYLIRELNIRQILDLKEKVKEIKGFDDVLNLVVSECTDIPKDVFFNFTFSDIEELIKAMKAVNESFFKIPGLLGLEEISHQFLMQIKKSFLKDWEERFVLEKTN